MATIKYSQIGYVASTANSMIRGYILKDNNYHSYYKFYKIIYKHNKVLKIITILPKIRYIFFYPLIFLPNGKKSKQNADADYKNRLVMQFHDEYHCDCNNKRYKYRGFNKHDYQVISD